MRELKRGEEPDGDAKSLAINPRLALRGKRGRRLRLCRRPLPANPSAPDAKVNRVLQELYNALTRARDDRCEVLMGGRAYAAGLVFLCSR